MNRRDLLKSAGAAILPVAILGPRLGTARHPAGPTAMGSRTPVTAVIHDPRYGDCRRFAAACIDQGAVSYALSAHGKSSHEGDSAHLWQTGLRGILVENNGSVAGFTTVSDFDVSRSCGRELGLKLIYRGSHDSRASANITHRLRTDEDAGEIARAFAGGDPRWAENLARVLFRLGAPGPREMVVDPTQRARLFETESPRPVDHPGYLVSWLLAPPNGARQLRTVRPVRPSCLTSSGSNRSSF
jgi:hypothetical protein